jgi:hypothetical protein
MRQQRNSNATSPAHAVRGVAEKVAELRLNSVHTHHRHFVSAQGALPFLEFIMYYTDTQIQSYLLTRMTVLASLHGYTVRQIFSKFIAHFDGNERRQFGRRVLLGKLPLRQVDDTHNALKYAVVK